MASSKSATKLTVYRGFDWPGRYTWSPFVTKLETRLRFAGLPYVAAPGSTRSAPKGKIPYIDVPGEEQMGDSTFIIRRLVEKDMVPDLNAGLSKLEHAQDLAWRALMEDKLYFYGVRERWQDNYVTMRSTVMSAIPYPLQLVIGLLAYKKTTASLNGQGTGLLTHDQMMELQEEGWEALNAQLAQARQQSNAASRPDEPFWILGGQQPTEADATLMGFIVAGLSCTAAPAGGKVIRSHSALVDYSSRIHNRYFSDYEKWSDELPKSG
ncbi:hypothetical protein PG989_000916 [Apiospora arundinis]